MTVHLGRQMGSISVRALTTALALRSEQDKTLLDLSYNTVFILAAEFNFIQTAVFIKSKTECR